jgi:dUTPase
VQQAAVGYAFSATFPRVLLNANGCLRFPGREKIVLFNSSDSQFTVRSGDRIAQVVLAPVLRAQFDQSDELSRTGRGSDGFGSTGA